MLVEGRLHLSSVARLTAPGFRIGDPGRGASIEAIASQVQGTLARFGVTVVTARPAEIHYTMAIVGGTAATFGFPDYAEGSTMFAACGTALPRRVIYATDGPVDSRIANLVIGGHLLGLGLPQSICVCVFIVVSPGGQFRLTWQVSTPTSRELRAHRENPCHRAP